MCLRLVTEGGFFALENAGYGSPKEYASSPPSFDEAGACCPVFNGEYVIARKAVLSAVHKKKKKRSFDVSSERFFHHRINSKKIKKRVSRTVRYATTAGKGNVWP